MNKKNTLKIQLRAFEHKWLERSIEQIKQIYLYLNKYDTLAENDKLKINSLARKYSYFTVIRSPHIDKKSGEKFTKVIYKKNIIFTKKYSPYLYQSLLDIIKQINWLGTEVQITSYVSTNKYKIK
jgi:ribosomal protein S10